MNRNTGIQDTRGSREEQGYFILMMLPWLFWANDFIILAALGTILHLGFARCIIPRYSIPLSRFPLLFQFS